MTVKRTLHQTGLFAGALAVIATGLLLWQAPFPDEGNTAVPPHTLWGPGSRIVAAPLPEVVAVVPSTVADLQARFNELGYDWNDAANKVPRIRVERFPTDIGDIPEPAVKKQLFFQAMLPLVLMENERILTDRARLLAIDRAARAGFAPAAADQAWMNGLAARYRVTLPTATDEGRKLLLSRANAVPHSLVLAMAATESGWGSSRFCAEGNNLFGQWTYKRGTGMVPKNRTAGARHEVAVFSNLADSVRAYLHNLNTHRAYAKFRAVRAQLGDLAADHAGPELARTLTQYSERGSEYTDDLELMIRANALTRFDRANLDTPSPFLEALLALPAPTRT